MEFEPLYRKILKDKIRIRHGVVLKGRPFSPMAFFIHTVFLNARGNLDDAVEFIRAKKDDDGIEAEAVDLEKMIRRVRGNEAERLRFARLIVVLENERRRIWIGEAAPAPAAAGGGDRGKNWAKVRAEVELLREICAFIKSRNRPTTMRELERDLRPRRSAAEIKKALEWRFLDPALRFWTRRKSRIFLWRPVTTELIVARNAKTDKWAIEQEKDSWRKFRDLEGDEAYREAWKKHVEEMARRKAVEKMATFETKNPIKPHKTALPGKRG